MKRIVLFLATNLAVVLVLSVVARLLGLDAWLAVHGSSLGGLLVFAAFFGFSGSFISLAMSKWMAKMTMGVRVIEPPGDATEQWLLSVVEHHARAVGVGMPEVGVFDSPEPNAFATGASRNAALVAVSSGLLPSQQFSAFGIAGGGGGLTRLFMSHPPLEERIAALRALGSH